MIHMPKTVLLLLGVILYLCVALVRVESQRHALWEGMCHSPFHEVQKRAPQLKDVEEAMHCVLHTDTRTHALWHLWYALVDRYP
jgi:hypothetical protein